MRTIKVQKITDAVTKLVLEAAVVLRSDVKQALESAVRTEKNKRARRTLQVLLENAMVAQKLRLPICQDTGLTVVYCKIGRDVIIKGNLDSAIQKGIVNATRIGYLRRSIVNDPIERTNTGTNAPGVIHYSWRNGSKIKISVLLKGFGCENKGQVVMLNPTVSTETIKNEIIRIISEAGPHACPPYVIGVGLGGTLDKAAAMAKESLLEPIGKAASKKWETKLRNTILKEARTLNIGPLGLGGNTAVLDVKIKSCPTHIAGLPLAVNINCHALRSKSAIL